MTGLYENDVGTASYMWSDRGLYSYDTGTASATLSSAIYNKIEYDVNSGKYYLVPDKVIWKDYTGNRTSLTYTASHTNWDTTDTTVYGGSELYHTHEELVWSGNRRPVPTPGERMRAILRSRHAPAVIGSRRAMTMQVDAREARARSTLRNILGESSFRRFLRDGFITVIGKSGLTYRIKPGHGITNVYDRGIMVETMCVVLKGRFPPTDELIMRYLLILNDEEQFSKYAVRHRVSQAGQSVTLYMPQVERQQAVEKSLPELFAELKAVA